MSQAIRDASAAFLAAGVPSPRHDAEALAAHVLGTKRGALASVSAWPEETAVRFRELVERRIAREPLQHLTGVAYFRHLELAVGPGVFVPRPETELLVDLVLDSVTPGTKVVDLCAGSGAVGLAIATERPGADVHLVEADAEAARWLRRNVAAIAPHVTVHEMSVRDALATLAGQLGSIDVVVANPPYLPTGGRVDPGVDPEVERDPAAALWGGADGLAVVHDVVAAAAAFLKPGGVLAVEHDVSHQDDVVNLLRHSGFGDVVAHPDLTGRARFVSGRLLDGRESS